MQPHTFLKEYDQWFIDLPEYIANGGFKGDLQMVEGADTMLDIIAGGQDRVTIALDTEPFSDADELTLLELCDPIVGGGYYMLESFEGKRVSQQMWLCAVTQFVFGYMPEKIFVKRVRDGLKAPSIMVAFFFIAMLFACNPKSNDNDIQIQQIIVKRGWSYKIDLEKETYTVYFMNGTNYDCKFTLSDKDKMEISAMAKFYGLTKLKGNIQVEDNCDMNPKVMTELSFYAGDSKVQVSIDTGCDEHPFFKKREPEEILKFLKFLHEKVFSKPEVAKAPQTDVRYM